MTTYLPSAINVVIYQTIYIANQPTNDHLSRPNYLSEHMCLCVYVCIYIYMVTPSLDHPLLLYYDGRGRGSKLSTVPSTSVSTYLERQNITKSKRQKAQQTLQFRSLCANEKKPANQQKSKKTHRQNKAQTLVYYESTKRKKDTIWETMVRNVGLFFFVCVGCIWCFFVYWFNAKYLK